MSRMSASKTRLSQNWSPTSSLQSPTVRTEVSEETARHSAVRGLLTFSRVASGAQRSTSVAMRRTTGMLRSERAMPPGPTESPTGCQIP